MVTKTPEKAAIYMEGVVMMNKTRTLLILSILLLLTQTSAHAGLFDSEAQLGRFLDGIADFLIRIVGPGVLVIGVCIGGISMATGNEMGVRRGIFAAFGGAVIMLSRSILDLIQRLTGF